MVSDELIRQHVQDRVEDLALHRKRFADLSDDEWTFFLQQIEGYQRTKDKLPTFASSLNATRSTLNAKCSTLYASWWYPPRLSCEQCSSEATARYKAELCHRTGRALIERFANRTPQAANRTQTELAKGWHLIDLTGGAGVDTFFFSNFFSSVDFIEKDVNLCFLARHNLPFHVTVHNTTAEEFLNRPPSADRIRIADADGIRTVHTPYSISEYSERSKLYTIYIDPARRDKNGGKVFRLEDCTPNVVELLPRMREVADTIMIKLSPMLDITAALRRLGGTWQVHVVAVKNEVKEVLLLSTLNAKRSTLNSICAVDLAEGWRFEFTREEEDKTTCSFTNLQIDSFTNCYLYEPCAAILKAGAYKLVGARYGLNKLDVNTHLYVSDQRINDFPGRVFRINRFFNRPPSADGIRTADADRIKTVHTPYSISEHSERSKFNVLTRNYVMGAEELKKKLKVRDGGTQYIIGTRVNGKPVLLMAERLS